LGARFAPAVLAIRRARAAAERLPPAVLNCVARKKPMDQLAGMRLFVAVADARGFAAAARALRISAPAATRGIAALEARLGVRLLNRTTRQMSLTEAGERYLVDCRAILTALGAAEERARAARREPQGVLAVTAPVMFGRMHIAPLLHDFMERHPKVTVRATFVDRIVNLIEEGVDVALRIDALADSSLTAVKLGTVRRVVVAAPDYLAAHGTPRKPADVARHRAYGSGRAPWRFRGVAVARAQPRMLLKVNGGDVAIAFALAGRGLARPLSYQVEDELRDGRLREVLADYATPPIPVHLVHPQGRQAAAKVRAFVDFAAARLRALPALRQ
jgi:DNA-binding transcriptional LysR family regulator